VKALAAKSCAKSGEDCASSDTRPSAAIRAELIDVAAPMARIEIEVGAKQFAGLQWNDGIQSSGLASHKGI
jgi:hypothetical protein